jgi:hypothetical protein
LKLAAALLLFAANVAAPASAAAKQSLSFGRAGGNIRPLEVVISPTGRVVVDNERRGVVTQARLRALRQFVVQARFATLPARIVCTGVLPDIATRHVVASGKSVRVRGGCNARFNRVYAALAHAAGVA